MTAQLSVVLLSAALLIGCLLGFRNKTATHQLNGRGRITVPGSLQPVGFHEIVDQAEATLFPFEHHSNSFRYMGSNAVIIERLVVGVWNGDAGPAAHRLTTDNAPQRVNPKRCQWRTEGEYEIGEGVQEVNAAEFPVWIVSRDLPSKKVTVAYAVWKTERSLRQARAVVDAALETFEPASAEQTRAHKMAATEMAAGQREQRRQRLTAALAAHGITLAPGGGPVEKDGCLYELHTDKDDGLIFSFVCPVGELGPAEDYRFQPGAPDGVSLLWMNQENGRWTPRGMAGTGLLTRRLLSMIRPGEGYAYAMARVDNLEYPEFDLERGLRTAAAMRSMHRAGKLVVRIGQ